MAVVSLPSDTKFWVMEIFFKDIKVARMYVYDYALQEVKDRMTKAYPEDIGCKVTYRELNEVEKILYVSPVSKQK